MPSLIVDYASVDGSAPPNWTAARKAGCRGAIIRAAYAATSKSRVALLPDPHFARDWIGASAAGMVLGAYVFPAFPRPGKSVPTPAAQALTFFTAIDGKLGVRDFSPWFDLEFSTDVESETGLTPVQMIEWCDEWMLALDRMTGVTTGIYTSARVAAEPLHGVSLERWQHRPHWIKGVGGTRHLSPYLRPVREPAILHPTHAPDPNLPPTWGNSWMLEQYQGDAIGFPGFSSTVDVNRVNVLREGSRGDLVAWMQRALNRAESAAPLREDGMFGEATEARVREFQTLRGLAADGIVGPATLAVLTRV